jgi:hypothetical protein
MQQHALAAIDAGKDEQVPEADEILLELLTEAVRAGQRPTPGDLLDRARKRDQGIFGPTWQASAVSRRLKNYGIPVPKKRNGRRDYRVEMPALLKIQQCYGIEIGIPDPSTQIETSTLIDPVAA